MPVDTRKAAYDAALPEWQIVRDCIAGESAIKSKTDLYLPVPSALAGTHDPIYRAYLKRAKFADIVAPTVRGIIGALFRRPATVELPTRIEYLLERATPDGLTLESLAKRIAREVLITGRSPLMVELPKGEITRPRPYLAAFEAETFINWRETVNNEGERTLSLAVLETDDTEEDADDPFKEDEIKRWRVLRLVDGRYEQTLYEKRAEDNSAVELKPLTPTRRGQPLNEIPLVVIGATDVVPDIDEIPLLGLSRAAIAIYQQYADYRQTLYLTSQPTHYGTGIPDDEKPTVMGAGAFIAVSSIDAKLGILEFAGAGAGAQRTAIEDEYSHAVQLGAAMLEQNKRAAEAAEALRLRQSGQSATLHSIASAVGDGILQCLRWAAIWADANPNEVVYEPNMDFVESEISPQLLHEIVAGWQSGGYPKSVVYHNLRKAEFIPGDMTDEDLESETDSEGPALGTIGLEREPEETDEAA